MSLSSRVVAEAVAAVALMGLAEVAAVE